MKALTPLFVVVALASTTHARAADATSLANALRGLDARVIPADSDRGRALSRMVADDVRRRMREANERENAAWRRVATREDWEAFRDTRIKALRESVGPFPPVPKDLNLRVTRTIQGEGYRIENLVYETRPGLVVTANLYLPATPPPQGTTPGFLISHSHHTPKTNGELQDMGINWARLGCAVLVPDHLGHGERRQHPFDGPESYPGPFKPGRQDYYFRHNTAMQLHLAGESLIGWMVWDLMRGVDVLLEHAGADHKRIILIGAVAGGGDPAGVTAALDDRIAAVAPFNFGGPQPDYEIPDDAERDFYFFGIPYWETTRCLRRSAADGFAHWLIVASVAPRPLIYSHEFSWDRARDPVWPRIERVFGLYDAADHLSSATGRGSLRGNSPDDTHCTHVGPVHRAGLYAALQRWFGIDPPAKENEQRHSADELTCLTPDAVEHFKPRPLHALAAELGAARAEAARHRLAGLGAEVRREQLRRDWTGLLGNVDPAGEPKVVGRREEQVAGVSVERIELAVEPGIAIPVLLLVPQAKSNSRPPVVVAFAQAGKVEMLRERAAEVAELLAGGVAVCLPDLRGTGESTLSEDNSGRNGERTDFSQAELMLGHTMLGSRLRDLRSVLHYTRARTDLDAARFALWGDSLSPPNAAGTRLEVPQDANDPPRRAEPAGAMLALLGALFEDDVRAACGHGGLTSFQSCLTGPFPYVPHDMIVPGALTGGDVDDLAAALGPRPVRLTGSVDGLNRPAADTAGAANPVGPANDSAWLLEQLTDDGS
jgi:cephalosporin-C deacetylase-like acetyl esterase